jgi:hypothetical protein
MRSTYIALAALLLLSAFKHTLAPKDFETVYEKSDFVETASYDEVMECWQKADTFDYSSIRLRYLDSKLHCL